MPSTLVLGAAEDCARSYGHSEEFLGAWLRQKELLKEDVAVGSKRLGCTGRGYPQGCQLTKPVAK